MQDASKEVESAENDIATSKAGYTNTCADCLAGGVVFVKSNKGESDPYFQHFSQV